MRNISNRVFYLNNLNLKEAFWNCERNLQMLLKAERVEPALAVETCGPIYGRKNIDNLKNFKFLKNKI